MSRYRPDRNARTPSIDSMYCARSTLETLGKVFQYRSCNGAEPGRRSGSPCLDFYIKRCGAPCVGEVTVCVPHDQGNGNFCADGGPLYDATLGGAAPCSPSGCDVSDCRGA